MVPMIHPVYIFDPFHYKVLGGGGGVVVSDGVKGGQGVRPLAESGRVGTGSVQEVSPNSSKIIVFSFEKMI